MELSLWSIIVTNMKINLSWEDYPCEPDQLTNQS